MENTDKKRDFSFLKNIFRFMMEEGYHPTFEKTHILFELDDNLASVEYENGLMTVRIFFSIEEESRDMFLDAANSTMSGSIAVKPVILEDGKTLMFSIETMCDNIREFKKFFPRSIGYIRDALLIHRHHMKLLLENSMLYKNLYSHDYENEPAKKFCS